MILTGSFEDLRASFRLMRKLSLKSFGFAVLLAATLGLFSGCAEVAGSGAFVSIPAVSISCVGGGCAVSGTRVAYVSYTTSSCAAAEFGETVTGSANVTCNGAQCTGLISQFVDIRGLATSMKEGFYSVCVTIDVDNNWIGQPASGDMQGGLANVHVTTGTATQAVTSYAVKP